MQVHSRLKLHWRNPKTRPNTPADTCPVGRTDETDELFSAAKNGDLRVVERLVDRFDRDGHAWSTATDAVRQLFCPARLLSWRAE
jgi:hypothetical protein